VNRSGTIAAPVIRGLTSRDREAVEALTRRSDSFRPEEIAVAMDVFDSALGIGKKADPDYELTGVDVDGILAGWACWGPTPCTIGTFDLYWIVVDRTLHGKGIGTALMDEMERRVAGRARLIVIETAGKADYAGTRVFYERRGYRIASTVADYYAEGDDLVVFVKHVDRVSGVGGGVSLDPDISDTRNPIPETR
jgi:ribosomal protein S18 acetylase RimI-like enzyme